MPRNAARKPGRPTLCTPAVRREILRAVRKGLPPERAAIAAGIGRSTLQLWRSQAADGAGPWPSVEAELAKARNAAQEKWLGKIDAASNGNWQAAAWLLERTDRETYALQNTVQVQIQVSKEREALLDLAEEVLERAQYERLLGALASRGGVDVPAPRDGGGAPAPQAPGTVH